MSYSSIEKRLANGKTIILDGGIGGELQKVGAKMDEELWCGSCLLYTSPSPRDRQKSRMPSSA